MKEQQVAKAYAGALIKLADEFKINIIDEFDRFNQLLNKCNDFDVLLFLETFSLEEKKSVVLEIFKVVEFSSLFKNFLLFLLEEKRISILAIIFKELVVLDDHNKGFLRGNVFGGDPKVNLDFKNKIIKYLHDQMNVGVELSYHQDEKITAGYKVRVEDLQLDATFENQMDQFKKDILKDNIIES